MSEIRRTYDSFLDADVIFPEGSFEVDGIVYVPPWERHEPHLSVAYQPMIDLKDQPDCKDDGSCVCMKIQAEMNREDREEYEVV